MRARLTITLVALVCAFAVGVTAVSAAAVPTDTRLGVTTAKKKKCKKKKKATGAAKRKCKKKRPAAPPVTPTPPPAPPVPAISVNDLDAAESNSTAGSGGSFSVTLSEPTTNTVQVTFETESITATAGLDYVALPPTVLTFTPGQTVRSVQASVISDRTREATETFRLKLTAPVNATLADSEGIATVTDDDLTDVTDSGQGVEADLCSTETASASAAPTASFQSFGQLFETGVTENPGSPPGVLAFIFVGPANTDPRTALDWRGNGAGYNGQVGSNDRYLGTAFAPFDPGTYSYVLAFSLDGQTITYCDLDGTGSSGMETFDPAQMGQLTVTEP